ncbi:MAG: hypothetical protein ABL958_06875 [Bdellovibrionia bacterium]
MFSPMIATIIVLTSSVVMAAETAKVLPKGIFRARVVGVQTEGISDRYNEDGMLEGFSAGLNRTVTVQDLAAKDANVAKLVNALNGIQAGLGNQLMTANIYSTFETQQRSWMPALEYGISERTTIGVRVPIVRRFVQTDFWVDSNNQAYQTALGLGAINPDVQAGLGTFGATNFGTPFFAAKLFTDKGYEVPRDFDVTEFGDVELGAKFNFYKHSHWIVSMVGGLRIPTGSTAALNNIFDKGSGTGAWGIGAQFVEAYVPASWVTLTAMQKMTYSFPDTRDRAVPKDENDTLPSLLPADGQVQSVTRNQTAEIVTELSSTFYFDQETYSAWTAYQYGYKGHDRYTGAGNLYYAGLSKGTNWQKHTGELGVGYSTIPAFRKQKFPVPGELQLLYNTLLDGQNVPLSSYVRMDFIAYF